MKTLLTAQRCGVVLAQRPVAGRLKDRGINVSIPSTGRGPNTSSC